MRNLGRDIRLALRVLAKNPGLTIIALISLALGIGANAAIFSLLNAILLRPLPVPHPEQLVALATTIADNVNNDEGFTWPMFIALSQKSAAFSAIFIWDGGSVSNLEVNGSHFAAPLAAVSGNYYQAVQTTPLLGRYITPRDVALRTGISNAVAVISYRAWRNWFEASPDVIGRVIHIGAHPYTVIGVEPPGFSGFIIDGGSDVTVPYFSPGTPDERGPYSIRFNIFARMKRGVTIAQARAEIQTLWPQVQQVAMPPDYSGERKARFFARKVKLEPSSNGVSYLRRRFSYSLRVLMIIVAAVLFIACLNIANLSLAKVAAHRHQSGVRAALGATTWDLLRPVLVESLLLSSAGALLGLLLAIWASRMLLHMAYTGFFATAINPAPDLAVFAFTAAITLATGLLFGIVPALYSAHTDPMHALKQQSRSVQSGAGIFGKCLLVTQIALSLILVLAALLFGRTLSSLHNTDVGYRRDHLLTLQLFPQSGASLPQNPITYYRQLTQKVQSIPGVDAVSFSNGGPANEFEDREPVFASLAGDGVQAIRETIAPSFFSALGMHLMAGRDIRWSDAGHDAAILSQSLAERLLGRENPIGRAIYLGPHSHGWRATVVGVVNDASLWKVESVRPMAVYAQFVPDKIWNEPIMDVRTTIDPQSLKFTIEKTVREFGQHYSLRTMTVEERLDSYITVQRLTALLSALFGVIALLIACVGLYGLMSFHVNRRTTELGIRYALGAGRRQLLSMVLKEALLLTSTGCVLGLAASLVAGRFLRTILFGVTATDPVILGLAIATMLTVGATAAFIPARRAAQIDPMTALRTN